MAKRFTDTEKYKKQFIRGLPGAYKLLWDYLYHDCNHAGIWHVDFEIAQIYVGNDMKIFEDEALRLFNKGEDRILVFDGGTKWLIKPFISFQYGDLNENVKVHKSVIDLLRTARVWEQYANCLQTVKDKDIDKDKEKALKAKNTNINFISDKIVSKWNEKMPWKVTKVNGRMKKLSSRLKEEAFCRNFDVLLDIILENDFLSGRKPSEKNPNFRADFDWIIANDTNYVKVLEGKYDR